MVSRFSDLSVYREIFKTSDFLKVTGATLLILFSQLLKYLTDFPSQGVYINTLLIVSIGINGLPIILEAFKGLIEKKVNVDELVSIALIACVATGNYLEGAVVCAIMVFGTLIEEGVSDSARREIEKMVELTPKQALIEKNGEEISLPTSQVKVGNILLVKAGEIIPLDGVIITGSSSVDESSITGESLPIQKNPADPVSGGTTVQEGFLRIRVQKDEKDSTIGRVAKLISEAENGSIESSRLVDKYAAWFTPIILFLAMLTFLLTRDITRATTVLIVGCPCSFLLTGPVTTVAAIGRAARAGILVKGGKYLERVAEAKAVFFDKTGTLTTGNPRVVKLEVWEGHQDENIIQLAASVERGSTHPLGRAIIEYAKEKKISYGEAENIVSYPGRGISGKIEEQEVFLKQGQSHNGVYTTVDLLIDGTAAARISLQDLPREESPATLEKLKKMGIEELTLISGDQEAAVAQCAQAVKAKNYYASLKPVDKLEIIKNYPHNLIYVGDGINDTPALKAAPTGIAMGFRGANVALETADIVLLNDRIEKLPFLIRLGRKMKRVIKSCIALSLIINLISLILASMGILTPILGAISHNIGSLLVVTISSSLALIKE
jgi:Zn2+/Cd2+-exporting ATPase